MKRKNSFEEVAKSKKSNTELDRPFDVILNKSKIILKRYEFMDNRNSSIVGDSIIVAFDTEGNPYRLVLDVLFSNDNDDSCFVDIYGNKIELSKFETDSSYNIQQKFTNVDLYTQKGIYNIGRGGSGEISLAELIYLIQSIGEIFELENNYIGPMKEHIAYKYDNKKESLTYQVDANIIE